MLLFLGLPPYKKMFNMIFPKIAFKALNKQKKNFAGNLLVDQATCSDGRVVDRARAWCSMIGIPYFR